MEGRRDGWMNIIGRGRWRVGRRNKETNIIILSKRRRENKGLKQNISAITTNSSNKATT